MPPETASLARLVTARAERRFATSQQRSFCPKAGFSSGGLSTMSGASQLLPSSSSGSKYQSVYPWTPWISTDVSEPKRHVSQVAFVGKEKTSGGIL